MFKKIPNFLNSVLQLQSAPSIRFWQQTAVCPVSLWALVVKLHPLNWTCALAVCSISDKVTMKELEEQRVCMWNFAADLVKILETFHLLNQAYGEDCMSRMQCYEWFQCFKEGRMSVGEDHRPEWPSTSTNNDHVERVCAVIRLNCCLTVREVADKVDISIGSCH